MINQALFSSLRDNWETPKWLFDKCDSIWHFTLDAASNDQNALCDKHYTELDDGLSKDWGGQRVWCNPPYGRSISKWVQKAYEESRKPNTIVIMLLPARTDTAYFHDYVVKADEISLIRGRIKFTINGEQGNSAPFPSMLVRFGGSLPKDARSTKREQGGNNE